MQVCHHLRKFSELIGAAIRQSKPTRKNRCFISFDFFILSLFFFFAKVGKKANSLLVHFGSILLALPILDRFLLQIYEKIIKESHKSIKKAANGSFFTICSYFLFI